MGRALGDYGGDAFLGNPRVYTTWSTGRSIFPVWIGGFEQFLRPEQALLPIEVSESA